MVAVEKRLWEDTFHWTPNRELAFGHEQSVHDTKQGPSHPNVAYSEQNDTIESQQAIQQHLEKSEPVCSSQHP